MHALSLIFVTGTAALTSLSSVLTSELLRHRFPRERALPLLRGDGVRGAPDSLGPSICHPLCDADRQVRLAICQYE